jgi:hypothetical protein
VSLAAVDVGALAKMLYSAVAAGLSVAVIFSIVILGSVRSIDMRRAGRGTAAAAYAALATVGVLLVAGVVVYGLILVAHKG